MDELTKRENLPDSPQSENVYRSIRGYVIEAQGQVYTAVNAAGDGLLENWEVDF